MPVIALHNRRFHYEDSGGSGTPVLALHGSFGRGTTFARIAELLAPEYRVIAPDLRGHGLSEGGGPFGRDEFVADAAGFVEALELAPVLLLGHSLGGVTAYQLAARRPELVRAVVVEDVGAVTDVPEVEQPVLDVTRWPRSFSTYQEAVEFFAMTPAPGYFLESVVERGGRWELLYDLDELMAVQRGNTGAWWDDWVAVPRPLLLLRASKSFLLSSGQAAEMVARRPGTELVTLDCGHWIHREDPDGYVAAVRAFLAAVRTT
ncbi:pimeloyl-ACP methyl ester carboxylesterase [Kribbella amoyensis]|uniref:Pimeloyl-ACP methyl ester carboxylesterase n=1 Tax=Kribbella amoyensis TaxID=996641 RepID=A0A561BX86_9ACTN|nr:alpha/beta hydrolase [Kribbella amoyensis]TWD83510.1 pimeloyl-ACP methyl ester carboxylesterase [Kribbella amoyensis]